MVSGGCDAMHYGYKGGPSSCQPNSWYSAKTADSRMSRPARFQLTNLESYCRDAVTNDYTVLVGIEKLASESNFQMNWICEVETNAYARVQHRRPVITANLIASLSIYSYL